MRPIPSRIGEEATDELNLKFPMDPSPALFKGLELLRRARRYAKNVQSSRWEFGVEIDQLFRQGLTRADLRWLVARGVIEHQREVFRDDQSDRIFTPSKGLAFHENTVFALTDFGEKLVTRWLNQPESAGNDTQQNALYSVEPQPTDDGLLESVKPVWDPRSRVLSFGGQVVKRFRVPAKSQEIVLIAFQEEHWPPFIDDPLPWVPGSVPKQRLQNAIKRLNSSQTNPFLRFNGDGNGEGIGWSPTELAKDWLRNASSHSPNARIVMRAEHHRPVIVRRVNGRSSEECE